jgi:hypothetical protein
MNRVDEFLENVWQGRYGKRQLVIGELLLLPLILSALRIKPSGETFHVWTGGEALLFVALSMSFGSGLALIIRFILSSPRSKQEKALGLAVMGFVLMFISTMGR